MTFEIGHLMVHSNQSLYYIWHSFPSNHIVIQYLQHLSSFIQRLESNQGGIRKNRKLSTIVILSFLDLPGSIRFIRAHLRLSCFSPKIKGNFYKTKELSRIHSFGSENTIGNHHAKQRCHLSSHGHHILQFAN